MGQFSLAFAIGFAIAASAVSALPATNYVVHETRHSARAGISHAKRGTRLDPNGIIPLRIGLAQRNIDLGYEKLMNISHPSSETYGKHMTQKEVHEFFAPSVETSSAVHSWLVDVGIDATAIRQYTNKGWLAVDLPVSLVEDMFQTQYFEHEVAGQYKVGCDEYHVPQHLAEHIDYIIPGVKPSTPMTKRTIDSRDINVRPGRPGPVLVPPPAAPPISPSRLNTLAADLKDCSTKFTTACYRALYNVPVNQDALPGHEPAVYEVGDVYAQASLDAYWASHSPRVPKGTHPKLVSIDGGKAPVKAGNGKETGESDIDIEIMQSLIWPQTMVLYQVGDKGADRQVFLDGLLDALDGSYCPTGYNFHLECGTVKPQNVISISYGNAEFETTIKAYKRECNEYMKLGMQGITVVVASGDGGVGFQANPNLAVSCLSGSGQNGTIYSPSYPVTCPFVTAVGATQIDINKTIDDPESSMQQMLSNGDTNFNSGGGFSNYFPAPDYQKSAVSAYFKSHDPGLPSYVANSKATNIGENGGLYNRAGRGFPDVSANGVLFAAGYNGTTGRNRFDGTSLAAPFWGSIITLINQEREKVGKGTVGFINPVLYENANSFTDIKSGSNGNCGSKGFSAVKGWDPVTGLGTPDYQALLEVFLGLP